jgi:hypothetical protein
MFHYQATSLSSTVENGKVGMGILEEAGEVEVSLHFVNHLASQ